MWLEYIKERTNKSVLELKDEGFAVYYLYLAEEAIYIEDIYVKPSLRKSSIASTMLNTVLELGKKEGLKYVLGSCDPTTKGSTISMKAMLATGFNLYKVENGLVFLRKRIK